MDESKGSIGYVFRGSGVEAALLPRAPYDVSYTPDRLVAGFAFDIQCGDHAFASSRVRPFVTLPGSLALTPAGCDIYSRSSTGGEYLTVSVESTAPATELQSTELQYTGRVSKFAAVIAYRLRRQLLVLREDALACEELALGFLDGALARGNMAGTPQKPASSITPKRLRMISDLVEACLGEKLTIKQLADAIGLSSSYFIRAFGAATGLSPHAYVRERRLEEVRRRLASKAQGLAEIAVDCGFASQAHMTSSFSRTFGVPPATFRRQLQ